LGVGEGDKLISLDNEKQELTEKLPGIELAKNYQDSIVKQFEFFTNQHIKKHMPDY
jgi:hypothetical protein